MRPRIFAAPAAALLLTSCGYIGDPLPPLANIPTRVTDLAAIQRGGRIIAHFTIPQLTTEDKPIPRPLTLDLRVGPNPSDHFDENQWASGARHIPAPEVTGAMATYEIPSAEWIGKEVLLSVRVTAGNGKQSAWSNFLVLPVIAAPAAPTAITPAAIAQGVRLTWQGPGTGFRVLRKTADTGYAVAATVERPEWTDTAAEFGKTYHYEVQALVALPNGGQAESDLSGEVSITPQDVFPPATPTGLHADPAPGSIELAWDRNTEPDLAGYRVYRATGGGAFEKVADVTQIPSWSDRGVEPGKTYRYAVTAVDQAGNESPRSPAVSAALP